MIRGEGHGGDRMTEAGQDVTPVDDSSSCELGTIAVVLNVQASNDTVSKSVNASRSRQ
jgi:hypothetical protein